MLQTIIPILFTFVGLLAGLSLAGMYLLTRKYRFRWYSWVLGLTGLGLTLFAIAWSVTSVFEIEPQAASMGLIFFGGPGIIALLLTRRLLLKDTKREA